MKKLKTLDSSFFIGKSHFEEDGTQNYLVFQPMYKYFERIAGVDNSSYIYYWQSKGLSDEKINSIKMFNHGITANLDYYGTKTRVEFSGSCLKRDTFTFIHGKEVNITHCLWDKFYTLLIIIRHQKIVYLQQLIWLKMLILVRTNILDMELDLIDMEVFHLLVLDYAEM